MYKRQALDNPQSVTVSADGKSAYVASISDAVAVFDREVPPTPPDPPSELSVTVELSKRLSGSKLKATVSCDADCDAKLKGNDRIKLSGRASASALPVRPRSVDLPADEPAIVPWPSRRCRRHRWL